MERFPRLIIRAVAEKTYSEVDTLVEDKNEFNIAPLIASVENDMKKIMDGIHDSEKRKKSIRQSVK